MVTKTANLELTELQKADLAAADSFNDSLHKLDGIVQLAVISQRVTSPPAGALQGDRYILPPLGLSGVWIGHGLQVAYKSATDWLFYSPRPGWFAFVEDEFEYFIFARAGFWTGTGLVAHDSPRDASAISLALSQLIDVSIPTPSDGQLLTYDATSHKWVAANQNFSLEQLTDVEIDSSPEPDNEALLSYSSILHKWTTRIIPSPSLLTLTDVEIDDSPEPHMGSVLFYNSAIHKWVTRDFILGELIDVSLTSPADGQVLTFHAADHTWRNEDSSGGGGGGGGGNVTPDTHPTSADPLDDEFEATSLDAKWIWRNQTDSSAVLKQGSLVLIGPSTGGTNAGLIEQAAPATPWRFRAKVTFVTGANTQYGGIHIGDSATGKFMMWGWLPGEFFLGKFTSPTVFSAVAYSTSGLINGANFLLENYFEIENDGTNLFFRISPTGLDDTFTQVFTEAVGTFITPDTVGLTIDSQNVSFRGKLWCDWFRRMA